MKEGKGRKEGSEERKEGIEGIKGSGGRKWRKEVKGGRNEGRKGSEGRIESKDDARQHTSDFRLDGALTFRTPSMASYRFFSTMADMTHCRTLRSVAMCFLSFGIVCSVVRHG